jgi:hypothetical protein
MPGRRAPGRLVVVTVVTSVCLVAGCAAPSTRDPEASPATTALPPATTTTTVPVKAETCTTWAPDWRDRCESIEEPPSTEPRTTAAPSSQPIGVTPAPAPDPVPVEPDPPPPPPAPKRYALRGTFTVHSAHAYGTSRRCGFSYGYGLDDLGPGTQVTVTNQSGTVVGLGELDNGVLKGSVTCVFRFKVKNLPRSTFYAVEVAERGKVRYAFARLVRERWTVRLTLT